MTASTSEGPALQKQLAVNPKLAQSLSLETIPSDMHYLLLSELAEVSPSDIVGLAQSSKALRAAVLPRLYRSVALDRGPHESRQNRAYKTLIQAFRTDDGMGIAKHVRNLTIKSNIPPEHLTIILDKISEHGKLLALSWNTAAHMPRGIYDKIHSTWPDLELSVRVLNRQDVSPRAHQQMDMKLLSSPLLTRLTYVIYNQGYEPSLPSRSEWPKLTQALGAGGNIKVLRIQSRADETELYAPKIVQDSEPQKLARLDLVPGIRFSKLEELSIASQKDWGGSTYLWDEKHCRLFRDAVDLSRLRKLEFMNDNPEAFFNLFTGHLPSLKHFRVDIGRGSLEPVMRFIQSLDALQSLYIDHPHRGMDNLWPAIMRHKASLKELVFGPTEGFYYSTKYGDHGYLAEIANSMPKLERLGWDVPCEANIDPTYIPLLSAMNLKKLELFLHLPSAVSEYSDRLVQDAMGSIPHPPLDKENSKRAAIGVFKSVSERQEWPLEWLTLHLSRTGYMDRAQPFSMAAKLQIRRRTSASADATGEKKFEFRGGMNWYGILSLEEELSLEEP